MMKRLLTVITLSVLFGTRVQAQLGDPTPQEKAALDKVSGAIINTLDQFNSDDWDKVNDYYSPLAVNPNPAVPMDIDNNFERQYRVRVNSDRYNKLIKPLQEKIEEAAQQGNNDLALSIGKQYRALEEITVYAYVNRNNLNFNAHSGNAAPVQVKGTPYCYKVDRDQYGNKVNGYWLLFGNWAAAKPGGDGMIYHFIHPKKTPYVENVAVLVFGADDRIQELLKTIDWSQMQSALTL